jgi:hypothetical protein
VEHKDYYVYIYLDPRNTTNYTINEIHITMKPFYVGKGRRARWGYHLWEAYNYKPTTNPHKRNTILKIKEETNNDPPIVFVYENLSSDEAAVKEKEIIALLGRECNGGILTNVTEGGEGVSGRKWSEDQRKKFMKSCKKSWTSERRNIISQKQKTNNPMTGRTGEKHHNCGHYDVIFDDGTVKRYSGRKNLFDALKISSMVLQSYLRKPGYISKKTPNVVEIISI